jgi:hypothetical protein
MFIEWKIDFAQTQRIKSETMVQFTPTEWTAEKIY